MANPINNKLQWLTVFTNDLANFIQSILTFQDHARESTLNF